MKVANLKLVEVVTVADVDDENRVGNSLLRIWKLRFGPKATGKTLKLEFVQHFAAEV